MDHQISINRLELADCITTVFGTSYDINSIRQMQGGAQKTVYQLSCKNGFSFILYVWDLQNNYFQEEREQENPIGQYPDGPLFNDNIRCLRQLGVRTPELYYYHQAKRGHSPDFAFVELISGREATDYENADRRTQDQIFQPLSEMLEKMHTHIRVNFGTITGGKPPQTSCHKMMMDNAMNQLAYAAQHLPEIRLHRDKLLDALETHYLSIQPREQYGFIHGELGPNHVLVNERLEPVLIDVDGAMFFDVEHEHSFMEFRFANYDRYFKRGGLDLARMLFYKLHHHISYTAGGLKLLHRGYPDHQAAKSIADYNCREALRFIK